MFRIGEFSKLTRVSIRMLRYYDETGLLKPAETDMFTGYRLYTPEQIPVLNKIIFLRDVGCNVAEIASALGSWDDASITGRLEQKRRETESAIRTEQNKLAKIDLALGDISRNTMTVHCGVAIKNIPEYQVLSLRKIIPDYFSEGELWKELSGFVEKKGIQATESTFSIYHDNDYRESSVDVELCVMVPVKGKDENGFTYRVTEAVPIMASSMVYGPFENIAGAYRSVAGWLGEHTQYTLAGTSRQIVHRGPWNEEDPQMYLTEIQIPLEEIN